MTKQVYDPKTIEEKWQQFWEDQNLFQGTESQELNSNTDTETEADTDTNKMFLLFAFAYPSGSGLHVGHVESKTALDILARYYRMKGKKVFFPVGWDAFGLPAENYAIKTGIPPVETTKTAINTFRRQLKRIGISYDWENEIATCHPEYYKWTQWIFLQLYNKGLAYQKMGAVNWCPQDQTVLANEQVVNGVCERCGTEVVQKDLKQWYFKITDYKDELISGLDTVDWPEPTKQQQLNWIGRSEGATVQFTINNQQVTIPCFTTRLDTIYGVTFVVMSPEKFTELNLSKIQDARHKKQTEEYIQNSLKKTEEVRKIGEKNKTGVDTGLKVINPVCGEEIPLYVADYVLAGYGTGAVMGVPAHDERDKAFATKYDLPIVEVIADSRTINSGDFNNLEKEEAIEKISKAYSQYIQPTTTYKLRDWLISRQRYWGAPIPIVYDPEGKAHAVKEEHLPWMLPTDVDFNPTGESPLKSSKEFKDRVEKLYGNGWTPEYDTMDTFVDSSWYFMRYVDSRNSVAFADATQLQKWLPVDLYMIGPEHIVLHLLYARFFTKFLRDEGYLNFDEPFMKMRHQGMILGPDGKKMSKSKGNVINPDDIVEKFGADTLRMYEMFMGPLEADKPWSTTAVAGVYRFLVRVHSLVTGSQVEQLTQRPTDLLLERKLHQTIRKVTQDIPDLKFNTAIAALMEFTNTWEQAVGSGQKSILSQKELVAFIKLLAPFAPFLADELYAQAKEAEADTDTETKVTIHQSSWPTWDEQKAQEDSITIAVQVNGKVRSEITIPFDKKDDDSFVIEQALEDANTLKWLDGKEVKKRIYIPGKIVSLVV